MTRRKLSPFQELQTRHRLAQVESMKPVETYPAEVQEHIEDYIMMGRDIAYGLHTKAMQGEMFVYIGLPSDMPLEHAERLIQKAKFLLKEAGLKHPTAVSPVFDCPPMFD